MIRLATERAALFGAMLFTALMAFMPLAVVLGWAGLGEQGLTARRVSGTLWAGRLVEARIGDMALGDLQARLAVLPLFVGRARVELEAPDGGSLRGALNVGRHALGIDDVTASLATGQLFAPLPVTTLQLDDVSVRFRDGQCDVAEGRVRASLTGEAGGVPLPATLAGPARCEAGALLLPLVSQAGTETATLRVFGGGRYRAEFALRPTDPALAARLERTGFIAGPEGHRLAVEGRF